jgi:8-oxo-dGTP pyrophosphatase MutT (NUDIX family)
MNLQDLQKNIEKYVPFDYEEEKDKEVILKYIRDFDDVLTRNNEYGHFTASSWIVNKNRDKALMIYHNIYKSWAWTGGHADGEADLMQVALREAREETGLKDIKLITDDILTMEIVSVFGHVKRGKYVSDHVHLNLTYLLEADDTQELIAKEDENSGVKWIPIQEVMIASTEERMHPIYRKAMEKTKKYL